MYWDRFLSAADEFSHFESWFTKAKCMCQGGLGRESRKGSGELLFARASFLSQNIFSAQSQPSHPFVSNGIPPWLFKFRISAFYVASVEKKGADSNREFGCLSAQVPQAYVHVQNFHVYYQPGLGTFFSSSKSKNAENILRNVLLFYFWFRNYALLRFVYWQIMREHHTIYDNNNTEVMWESHLSFCFHSACENLKITTIPIWINILVGNIHLNIKDWRVQLLTICAEVRWGWKKEMEYCYLSAI